MHNPQQPWRGHSFCGGCYAITRRLQQYGRPYQPKQSPSIYSKRPDKRTLHIRSCYRWRLFSTRPPHVGISVRWLFRANGKLSVVRLVILLLLATCGDSVVHIKNFVWDVRLEEQFSGYFGASEICPKQTVRLTGSLRPTALLQYVCQLNLTPPYDLSNFEYVLEYIALFHNIGPTHVWTLQLRPTYCKSCMSS